MDRDNNKLDKETNSTMGRIEKEKKTVGLMIRLYCQHFEKNDTICSNCAELLKYAERRLERCKFGEKKPTCKQCPVHCYKPDMREHMRRVMRWAGPRMIFYYPVEAIRHLLREMF